MLVVLGFTLLSIGILLFILSVILFTVWKVPSLIDELSGRKAKRHINKMRRVNMSDTVEVFSSTTDNFLGSNNISGTISELGKLVADPYGTVGKIAQSESVKSANINISQVSDEDIATELFEEGGNDVHIVLIEEQTSLSKC